MGCIPGKKCHTGSDCLDGVCSMGICQVPTCTDGVKNGQETDVDCGGGTCPPCVAGRRCLVDGDCQSMMCTGGVCAP
jgi:hypothetical protein